MGIIELITAVLIALKLFGVIDWNWFMVFLPEIVEVTVYVILSIIAWRNL